MSRVEDIAKRAANDEYHCREHWGLFDADADVQFLLTELSAALAARHQAEQRAETAEKMAAVFTNLDAISAQLDKAQGADDLNRRAETADAALTTALRERNEARREVVMWETACDEAHDNWQLDRTKLETAERTYVELRERLEELKGK